MSPVPPLPSPSFAQQLLASYEGGLLAIGPDERIEVLSDEARRVLGLGPEACGASAAEALAALPRILDLLRSVSGGSELPGRAELELPAAGGQAPRRIGFTLQPVRDAESQPIGAAMFVRELHVLEQADEQARLQQRLASFGSMAADWAHEVQNPLATLQILAGLLERDAPEGSETRELVTDLREAVRELSETTRSALTYLKPEATAPAVVRLVGSVDAALARALDRVPFDGRVHADVDASLRVAVDPEQLDRLLTNLFVNALQAMGELPPRRGPHRLEIAAGADPRNRAHVLLTITDSGPGIPESSRERIFQPFFTTRRDGTGIGLADAQKIVVAHGGGLGVGPGPEGGASFRISLPGAPS